MFFADRAHPSFPSSPPSSPTSCLDSSPPSSPYLDAADVDLPEPPLLDPFAASAKANWRPPQYEKKRLAPPSTPPARSSAKRARHNFDLAPLWPSSPTDDEQTSRKASRTAEEIEEEIWDNASTKVVDEGHGAVNLDNHNLTHIPDDFISDLSNFYIPPESSELINSSPQRQAASGGRQLGRVATAPPSNTTTGPRLFPRTHSAATPSFGLPREKLQLFLSGNRIFVLPTLLFTLQNLSVLSIRGNYLTYIPPEIHYLHNLQTLNIANNKIKFLPAEMLQMSLIQLHLHPNPFIEPPPPSDGRPFLQTLSISQRHLQTEALHRRLVSKTKYLLPQVPPLTELSLRVLFSPSSSGTLEETVLEAQYDLPLDEWPIDPTVPRPSSYEARKQHFPLPLPIHIRRTLDACVPGSVYAEEESSNVHGPSDDVVQVTGIGKCPSPKHQRMGTSRVFVHHAEERFTWEKTIATVDVSGLVPLHWRGCLHGCLDFLDGVEESREDGNAVSMTCGLDEDWSENMELEGDTSESVVQVVQFGTSGSGGLDDFDD
ncbi:Leucine-rich repeat-containing protein 10B [Hypsizygus marmoreus]|uniref:Leucine-rich repeat-containing protein 10B n=1 Tax=Hypsizygus marmoreus TaxID=39966 RepID=A0A369JT84_HYPMA|nr:Leucine-rich repeat-containing protein 10B [Hypsizygus marmoreus]